MITIHELWAKSDPFQSVAAHGLISGIVAQEIVKHYLSEGAREQLRRGLKMEDEELVCFIGYLVSVHDIGKIAYSFQAMDEAMKQALRENGLNQRGAIPDGRFRHEIESYQALKRIWKKEDRAGAEEFAAIIQAHHQGKHHSAVQITAKGDWLSLQESFEAEMRRFFRKGETSLPVPDRTLAGPVSVLLLGILILSDWIASGAYFQEPVSWEALPEWSRERASAFLRSSGLLKQEITFGTDFCEVWPQIPRGGERALQKAVEGLFQNSTEKYRLILMEAPMGEGKTEAGVYAAVRMAEQWKKDGFYVALPTAATSNQMVGRICALLNGHGSQETVRLLHSMAWMVDGAAEQCFSTEEERFAENWLLPLRRGLLSQFAVGTVDQVMMAAMFIKYGVLRLLGLSGKVLIIDEVHAYDAYMQTILEGLLAWCGALDIPVVLLSATLPVKKKASLMGAMAGKPLELPNTYPSITAVTETGRTVTVPIGSVARKQEYTVRRLPILHRADRIAAEAAALAEKGGCVCVLLNTVAQAQEVYRAIRDTEHAGEVLLFHSRFPAERRDEIEKQCLKWFGKDKRHRPKGAILVATQVVEQSLDVDFDHFLSAIAPMDLLIQRMGRQFRHSDTPRPADGMEPVFTVLCPADGKYGGDGAVYPECLLKRTEQLLADRTVIRVPEDIAELVTAAYDETAVPADELEKWMENLVREEMAGAAAEKYKLNRPEKRLRYLKEVTEFDDLENQSYLSAQTRLSEPTVRIAMPDPALMERLQGSVRGNVLPVSSARAAQQILRTSFSLRKKIYDRIVEKYGLLDILGDKMIYGVRIIPQDNPCIWADPELGILWKEEK